MGLYGSEPQVTTTSTSTQYSPEMEKRLIGLSERQVEMSEDQWNTFKTIFQPYEAEMVAYNRELLPEVQATTQATLDEIQRDIEAGQPIKDALRKAMGAETEAQIRILNLQADEIQRDIELGRPLKDALRESGIQDAQTMSRILSAQGDEIIRDIEQGRPVKDALRQATVRETTARTPAVEKFYKEAQKGVDVKERMGLATADVEQAYKGAEGGLRRTYGRMGLELTANKIKDLALAKVKDIVGARNRARIGAENETFGRLATAAGMPREGTGLPWTGSTGVTGGSTLPGTVSTATGNVNATGLPGVSNSGGYAVPQVGGYGLQNPVSDARAGYGMAASNYAALAPRGTTSTSTTSGGESGFGDFLGGLVGIGAGAFTGGVGTGLSSALFK